MWIDRREWLVLTAGAMFPGSAVVQTRLDRLALYPAIRRVLRSTADGRSRPLTPAGLELLPRHGALAASLDEARVTAPRTDTAQVPPDGQLVFAIDVPRTTWLRGTMRLEPDADLRPGLRARRSSVTTSSSRRRW